MISRKFVLFYATFSSYYFLLFMIIPQIRTYESSAWRMITDRLLANSIFGSGSFGNLLVIFSEETKKTTAHPGNSLASVNGRNMFEFGQQELEAPEIYTSQFGLLGDIGRILQNLLNIDVFTIYISFSVVSILISSLILARFCSVVSNLLGKKAGLGAMAVFLTPWPVLFASNFYYSIFGNLVFLLIPGLISDLSRAKRSQKRFENHLMICLFVFTFLFSLTNYTFVTVWVACIVLGLILVSSRERITRRTYVKAVGSMFVGFCCALTLHLLRVQNYAISIKQTSWLEYIVRNKIGVANSDIPPEYQNSTGKSPFEVADLYFRESLITPWVQSKLPHLENFLNGYTVLLILGLVLLIWIRKHGCSHRLKKLVRLNLIALSGPIGWILIMRPHSWDNHHINYIFMFLPFYPLLAASMLSLGEKKSIGLDELEVKKIEKFTILLISGMLILSLSIYLLF